MLADLQRRFLTALHEGPAALRQADFAVGEDRMTLAMRAHANMVGHARSKAMEDSFPHLRDMLGDSRFAELAQCYLHTDEARAAPLSWIGRGFPDWLRQAGLRGEASDLAAVEMAWLESFHAPDAEPLDGDLFRNGEAQGVANLAIRHHPAARIVPLDAPDSPPFGFDVPTAAVLLTRPALEVRLHPLDSEEAAMFSDLPDSFLLGDLLADAAGNWSEKEAVARLIRLIGIALFACAERVSS